MRLSLRASACIMALCAGGCSFASVSSVPIEVPGVGTVYRYQGRANFPHQIAEADRMMTEDCKSKNGGHPVVVSLQRQEVGVSAYGSGQSNTYATGQASGTPYAVAGSAQSLTTTTGSVTAMRNMNQEILYKCVVGTDAATQPAATAPAGRAQAPPRTGQATQPAASPR